MSAQIATDLSSLSLSPTDSTLTAARIEQNNNNNNNNSNTNCGAVRDVHRAGWLRFVSFDESHKSSSSDSSCEHRFWVVFSVYNESQPYLEFYEKSQQLLSQSWRFGKQNGGPVSTHSLLRCVHISPAIVSAYHNHNHSKANSKQKKRTLDRIDEFAITLDTHVIRLVADNQDSMQHWIDTINNKLRQLGVLQPQHNHYTKDPQLFPSRSSVRPLPPVPVPSVDINPVIPADDTQSSSQRSSLIRSDEQLFDELYETIFNATNNNNTNNTTTTDNSNSSSQPLTNVDIPDEDGPPPYESISGITTTARPLISLRQSQVLRLRMEISHPSGVRLMVRKNDCDNTIALVNMFGGVWIAGWKQKHHPYLHNTFHIGDQLISINNKPVVDSSHAYNLIKQNLHSIELIVRRVPFAKVIFIERQTDGQSLGIVREKNTAQVREVVANGLADRAGLSAQCRYLSCTGDEVVCNWCFTEINNRPLNLWFKSNEIETRLNSVGREVSILVQPLIFVKQLKKQLKQFRSYKQYIVQ